MNWTAFIEIMQYYDKHSLHLGRYVAASVIIGILMWVLYERYKGWKKLHRIKKNYLMMVM